MKQAKGVIALLLTSIIWGCAFVAQSVGNSAGPFTFNTLRTAMGFLVLIPVILIMDWFRKQKGSYEPMSGTDWKNLAWGGLFCGLPLGFASNLQQLALLYSSVGKVGFITTLYILIVPLLGLLMKKRISRRTWLAVILGVCGMYLLCITESFSLTLGDSLTLLSAFFFSFQIIAIDIFVEKVDGVKLSCAQFLVAAAVSAIGMPIFETPSWLTIKSAWLPLLYAGIMSCGVAYTLQIIGQKYVQPTTATLLMSLESCFALLAGMLLLREIMSGRELIGCGVMFAAVLLAQLPEHSKTEAPEPEPEPVPTEE